MELMTELQWSLLLGLFTVGLGLGAARFPLLAWVTLAPLGGATFRLSPMLAALAGAIAGAGLVGSVFVSRTMRPILPIAGGSAAVSWGVSSALVATLWPDGQPAWGALLIPALAVTSVYPLYLVGGPRWAANPLARTQERWLPVVHIARLGSDLFVTAATGTSAAIFTLLVVETPARPSTLLAAALAAVVVVGAWGYGLASYRRAQARVSSNRTLRVAAVVCDGPAPGTPLDGLWPLRSPHYADVDGTLERYQAHVAAAAAGGARVLVLPEVAVRVNEGSRQSWIDGVCRWAQAHKVSIVAPFYDETRPCNELVIVSPQGDVMARYEKQHPAPVEAKRHERMRPGVVELDVPGQALSTVICVDLDYNDLIRPVTRTGGILAAPSNDWPVFEALHHRTAVWAAVMSGVSLIRATGHGTSAAYDPSGRVLRQQSSLNGPVVLVADLPL
jgi:predicted amidohydrolase